MSISVNVYYWPNAGLFGEGHVAIQVFDGADMGTLNHPRQYNPLESLKEPSEPYYMSWGGDTQSSLDETLELYGDNYLTICFPSIISEYEKFQHAIYSKPQKPYSLRNRNCAHMVAQTLNCIGLPFQQAEKEWFLRPATLTKYIANHLKQFYLPVFSQRAEYKNKRNVLLYELHHDYLDQITQNLHIGRSFNLTDGLIYFSMFLNNINCEILLSDEHDQLNTKLSSVIAKYDRFLPAINDKLRALHCLCLQPATSNP